MSMNVIVNLSAQTALMVTERLMALAQLGVVMVVGGGGGGSDGGLERLLMTLKFLSPGFPQQGCYCTGNEKKTLNP